MKFNKVSETSVDITVQVDRDACAGVYFDNIYVGYFCSSASELPPGSFRPVGLSPQDQERLRLKMIELTSYGKIRVIE